MRTFILVLGALLGSSVIAGAQQPPADTQKPAQPPVYEDHIVVTASKVEEQLVNAPAAVSVVSSDTIETAPSAQIGDLLRSVPGVNVVQTSARDVNLVTRGAAGTLATSQLALVDGRSIYLDFFGMVMWDLVAANTADIKQIEVIRGPASAMWGANAMTGVVNILTKSPRELAADGRGSVTLSAGTFDRKVTGRDQSAGSLFSVGVNHAGVIDEHWSYKASAAYFTQDPLPRPTGTIPNTFHTPYPQFTNEGTSQPKFDGRLDYETSNGGRLSFTGGVAGTDGILYSGIGPFNIESGSRLGYFSARYSKGARRLGFFTNLLKGQASNLVLQGSDDAPLELTFDTKTFDVEGGDGRPLGSHHVLSYGGNIRHNTFAFSLSLKDESRDEAGGYVQDEIFLGNHVRWVVGGRLDTFSAIDGVVFSPRTTLLLKPAAAHTFRISFNRAFRAPSFTNNNLSTTIDSQLDLGLLNPALAGIVYEFPIHAVGNPDLSQETMTAYEVGYTGLVRQRATVTMSVYWNDTDGPILFTQTARYTAAAPPPGWPLPPVVLEIAAAAGSPLPSEFSYRNLGRTTDKGIELGVDAAITRYLNAFTNYTYQFEPEVSGFPISEINLPPNNRFNAGFSINYGRFFGNLSANYTDEAYWQDVLDARFHGMTDSYTLVNGAFGVRWSGNRLVTSVKVTNLGNSEVQQHIFGDVIKRQVVGEVRVGF